jgi:PhzF family phenazine biosynthesis protein
MVIVNMQIYQIDAFTAQAFHGNPAAVCLMDSPRPEAWMQSVAQEMNLSETAFLLPEGDGWRLRWFTPLVEVNLCGHATLASAHVLWETGRAVLQQPIHFYTRSGLLSARQNQGWIELDFPARRVEPAELPDGAARALGVEPLAVMRWKKNYLVEIASEAELRSLGPDFTALKALPLRLAVVTCRSEGAQFDFLSRFFAPAMGINEDPVNGATHCALGPYWGRKLGKNTMTACQASARGGVLRIRLEGERVVLGGHAVTVLRGEIL